MTDTLSPIAYPIEDVPAVAGVPRTKVFQAIRDRKLTARKAGRSTVILRDDLLKYLESLPIKGKPLVETAA